jgi:Xaa-Pro aminopeptidase
MSEPAEARRREVGEKRERLQRLMEARGLDAILISRVAGFAWATAGGASWVSTASEVGVATLAYLRDGRALALTDTIEEPRMASEELDGLGFSVVSTDWFDGPAARHDLFRRTAGDGLAVGSDAPWPGAEDLSEALQALRFELAKDEAERYRLVGQLAGYAVEEAATSVSFGMTEWEIASALASACLRRGLVPFVTLVAGDDRVSRYRHPIPTRRAIHHRAMLVLCARGGGLVANATRLVSLEPVADELRERLLACARVDATMMLSTTPGRTGGELFELCRDAYAREGYREEWRLHHQGGATGYEAREWVATPGLAHVVGRRQAFAWNPTITGVKTEDTILVSPERGLEVITRPERSTWPMIQADVKGVGSIERPDILSP